MSITVKGFTRHSDTLVTVHGRGSERNAANELKNPGGSVNTRQLVKRGSDMGMSPPGVYMNPFDTPPEAGQSGNTAHMNLPLGHLASPAVVRWRRTIMPLRGAYTIPKGE